MQTPKEKNALFGVFIGLGILSVASFAFGIYMIAQGKGENALPVMLSGATCAALIPLLAASSKRKTD